MLSVFCFLYMVMRCQSGAGGMATSFALALPSGNATACGCWVRRLPMYYAGRVQCGSYAMQHLCIPFCLHSDPARCADPEIRSGITGLYSFSVAFCAGSVVLMCQGKILYTLRAGCIKDAGCLRSH